MTTSHHHQHEKILKLKCKKKMLLGFWNISTWLSSAGSLIHAVISSAETVGCCLFVLCSPRFTSSQHHVAIETLVEVRFDPVQHLLIENLNLFPHTWWNFSSKVKACCCNTVRTLTLSYISVCQAHCLRLKLNLLKTIASRYGCTVCCTTVKPQ